jgi:predicted amidohydrolase YtcJ
LPRGSPDFVLRGAAVYTSVPSSRWAEAVAIREGRIVAVGTTDDVEGLIGPGTRVIDLPGRMICAGFQDSHIHPDGGGLDRMQCDLHDLRGAEAYEEAIRAYARSHPDAPWILGGGWALDDFPRGTPHRSILDAIVPDRGVYLPNRDGHGAWVNTRALEAAGITRHSPDPPDGRIERDEDGSPFGVLHEGAMKLVERLVPPPSPDDLERALIAAQAYLHSLGVTAWQDAHVTEATLESYLAIEAKGALTGRVVGALWWARDRGEEQVSELLALRARAPKGRVRATSVKIMQDGVPENFTAAMLEPYLDEHGRPSDRHGLSFVGPDALKRYVTRLDREGFQVHVHAIGDRAVREALDAFEAARAANGPNDHRHHIAHLQLVHPQDVPRFARLRVTANAQPFWACLDGQMRELCVPFFGPERTATQYPFASIRAAGGSLAFGSDWPVSTPDPLKEMQVAVTRVPYDERGVEPFLPHERLDLDDALDAFTIGTAFVNHLDADTGSIEPGKLADLVVLDRNLFEADPMSIGEARVLLTLVDGEPVHVSEEIDWPR